MPSASYDHVVETVGKRNYVVVGLGVALLVLGGAVWGQNVWAGAIYAVIAAVQVLIGLGFVYRARRRTVATSAGNVAVQHAWGTLSIGIAGAALIPSDFFAVDDVWLYAAVAIGLAFAVVGAHTLYWTIRSTDARLTI